VRDRVFDPAAARKDRALYLFVSNSKFSARQRLKPSISVAAGVTLVTINAVVDISRNIFVMEIGGIVPPMAARALKHRIVIRVRVARRTDTVGIAMAGRKLRVLRVIEGCAGPCGGGVAVLARGREELRLRRVTGVGCVVVVRLMASDASCGQSRVVAVDVAVGADPRRHSVRAGQREGRIVMVERGIGPDGCVMTDFARSGEARGGVRRVRRARVVLLMARVAKSAVQGIVVVDVAIGTEPRRHGMRARQLEAGGRVIERGVRPLHRVVTGVASGRERSRDVVHRGGRIVVIRLVARDAGGAGQVVIVVDVTIGASTRRHRVRASQREAGAVVIEGCVEPRAGAMALIASLREVGRHVIRVRGSLVVLQVATDAGRRVEAVVVVDVAIGALPRGDRVQSGEREAGAVVVERRVHPVGGVVTRVASLRKVRGHVIRIRGSLVVLQMAIHASRAVQGVIVVGMAIGASARRDRVLAG